MLRALVAATALFVTITAVAEEVVPQITATPTILVRSPDPAKLGEFYRALGFRFIRVSGNGGQIFRLTGDVGSLEVVKMDPGARPGPPKTSRTQQGVVAVFETDHQEELLRRAKAAGATLIEPWTSGDGQVTIYYIADPEHNILGFAPRRHNPNIKVP
jgi:predicted enzyme related to lactoylglutathione lyase